MKFLENSVRRKTPKLIRIVSIFVGHFSKKPFDIIDFGLCYLDDLIGELKDNKEVVIDHELGVIKLYRKGSHFRCPCSIKHVLCLEQTEVEKFATQIFADDMINMFRHQQDFNIPFQRFIPMYHHHFGYQCRVQLYGCLRLIDLFEEIPQTVQILEDKNGERIIQLTDEAIRQAVQLNIIQLIRQHEGAIPLDQMKKFYAETFRFELNSEEIGFDSLESLIESMHEKLTVRFSLSSSFDFDVDFSVSKRIKILSSFVW